MRTKCPRGVEIYLDFQQTFYFSQKSTFSQKSRSAFSQKSGKDGKMWEFPLDYVTVDTREMGAFNKSGTLPPPCVIIHCL